MTLDKDPIVWGVVRYFLYTFMLNILVPSQRCSKSSLLSYQFWRIKSANKSDAIEILIESKPYAA